MANVSTHLLILTQRKHCLQNCGYDKLMTVSLDSPVLHVEEVESVFKLAFPNKFTSHHHRCKIDKTIEVFPHD